MNDLCIHCGQPQSEHHEYETAKRPAGCVCDANTWQDRTSIPAVCEEHVGGHYENCERCEHDFECHPLFPEVA
jgi:hypothetical protein